jgi:glutamine amidotransferase
MIGVLDYGMGNLSSVTNALDYLGIDNQVIRHKEEFSAIGKLIIPGVGAYAKAMENIHHKQYFDAIKKFSQTGKPILGICLGMQLLSVIGTEPHQTKGLGLVDGEVIAFPDNLGIRVPHVGWNGISIINEHPILDGVKIKADFYFVHSYYFGGVSPNNIVAITNYGLNFPSIVCNDSKNVVGIQFHPEKSQKQGLQILDNFSRLPNA